MAPIVDGQAVNAANSNAAWLDAQDDDTALGKISLANTDVASGTTLTNIQREMNSAANYSGKTVNTAISDLPVWTDTNAGTPTDNLTERAEALTEKFNPTTGHTHDGTTGQGPQIAATDLSSVPLRGFIIQGTDLTGVTGSSWDVSTEMTGQTPSGGSTSEGVVVTNPENKLVIRQATGASANDVFVDSFGNIVYARLTESIGIWTLSFYVDLSGTETAYSFGSASDVRWYYQKLYNPMQNPPVYSEFATIPSDNATADVITATTALQGKVSLSSTAAQSVATASSAGTANASVANADHAHQGVHSVAKSGSAEIYGDVTLTGSGGTSLTQLSQNIDIASVALTANTPQSVGTSNSVGTGTASAKDDHVHQGVHSVQSDANPALYGDVTLASGTGITLSQVGQTITVDSTVTPGASLGSATPQDVGSTASVGVSTFASHEDHVHKGVHSVAKSGSAALYGDVTLSAGTNVTLTQTGQDIQIAASSGSGSVTNWALDTGFTVNGGGTVSSVSIWTRTVGDSLEIRGKFVLGTVAASTASLQLPSGTTINTAKMTSATNAQCVGYWNFIGSITNNLNTGTASGQVPLFYDGSTNDRLFFTREGGATANQFSKQNGNAIWGSNGLISFFITAIPVS